MTRRDESREIILMDAIAVLPPKDSMIEAEFDQGDSARLPLPAILSARSMAIEFFLMLALVVGLSRVFVSWSGKAADCAGTLNFGSERPRLQRLR
jgi:hypothetical protein